MENPEKTDRTTSFLFYFFIGQVVLGMLAILGYLVYSFFAK